MQLKDMNEGNKDNVMKADCMLIFSINHICERSGETDRDSDREWRGHHSAGENIEPISPDSVVQYEDEFWEI